MLSLRWRLLFGTAIGTAVILSVAGLALYLMMKASLFGEFDDSLRDKVRTLAGLIEQEGEHIELEFAEADMTEFERSARPEYFQLWLADGTVVERSPSLDGADLPRIETPWGETVVRAVVLPSGRPGRVATLHFEARPDDEAEVRLPAKRLVLGLARDVLDVESALADLRFVLALVCVLATLASVFVLAWLVRVGLKPVNRLAEEIGCIDERHLSVRMNSANSPRELRPVVNRLNDLLNRLEEAFAREKTLTADVAHELRTPLAGLRSTLEVALLRERDSGAYREAMLDCLEVCQQTQTMVDHLLALARLDAGNDMIRCRRTDVEELLQNTWKPFQDAASKKGLEVQWEIESGLTVETDPDKLRSVLGNLFENAVHYANTGGEVLITSKRLNGRLRIGVVNTGGRLSAEEASHVFERFWRGDTAREKDGVHCGLGLSLCKTIMERLGGTISADLSEDGAFSITLTVGSEKEGGW